MERLAKKTLTFDKTKNAKSGSIINFLRLFQCMVFSLKPVGDTDKKLGRFSVEQSLKRQKYVVHGFEARALKHIPKLIFKIGERMLKLCNCGPQYSADLENFTKKFVAYRYDAKGGKMTIGNYKTNGSNMATRRSSQR